MEGEREGRRKGEKMSDRENANQDGKHKKVDGDIHKGK